MEGRTLAHYRILEKIGGGGMGVVYRAHDERLERDVALKVLPPGLLSDEAARRRFRREALALSRLNHPGIATVFDFDTQEGVDFLVMEFVPGQTLAEKLAGGPLPEKEVASLGAQIASALEGAHERGVVHRDLKPGNIMVTLKGQAKVLDFGLAMLLRPAGEGSQIETLSREHAAVGTLPYMAPEQLRGERMDARSDIYAAGAVLYEMATRQRPFLETSAPRLIDEILHHAPQTPRSINGRISAALDGIIVKALDKEPQRRYQSAAELRVDLERLAAPVPLRAGHRSRVHGLWWALLPASAFLALAALIVGLNPAGVRERLFGRAAPRRIESLAVLPLENLSRDPEQEYFADGMTEELIADLGKIRALRVISRTSAMRYKGTKKSLLEIARELNVDALVEGSVLRAGDRVRITTQLIHAATDRHLWSESYERDLKDVLALQSEVARSIAREIKIALTPQEQARFAEARPVDPEARQLYLKARYYAAKSTQEGAQKALEYFQQSIDKDPAYAAAYAQLANTYAVLGYTGIDVRPSREMMPRAKAAALKALELDDTLAEAHTSLGFVRWAYDWNWPAAEVDFKRAIELSPGYATAHLRYANFLCSLGRFDEAVEEDKRSLELDPLSIIINHAQAWPYHLSRRYDQAIEAYRKTLEMEPNYPRTHLRLGEVYAAKGMYRDAIAEYEKFSALGGGSTMALALIGNAHAQAGERHEALRALEELTAESKRRYVPFFHIAIVHAGLGDKDQAFAWLDRAYEERSQFLVDLKFIPILDPLRSDPRFADLVRRVGLPP